MLDAHLVSGTGSTSLTTLSTIPTNDGATSAGVPIASGATLAMFGGLAVSTLDAINEIALSSNDLIDPSNKLNSVFTSAKITAAALTLSLPYSLGARNVQVKNAAAGDTLGFTVDFYQKGPACVGGSYFPAILAQYSTTFGAALTALTYGTAPLAPTTNVPVGKYAILGATTGAITNNAFLRFQHPDFGGYYPGFPVVSSELGTAGVIGEIFSEAYDGYQFVKMSQVTNQPCCPVFTVTGQGTGLNIQAISCNTDTPIVNLNLAKIG